MLTARQFCQTAGIKQSQGNYKGAIKDCNKAIYLQNDFPYAYIRRGQIKQKIGDFLGAIDDFNKAISLEGGNPDYYVNRGNSYDQIKDYYKAIQDYSIAITLNINHAFAYFKRGITKSKMETHMGAIEDYDKAISIMSEFGDFYFNRGKSKLKLGDIKGAHKDFTKTITLNNGDQDAQDLQKYCKMVMNDKSGAVAAVQGCIQLDQNDIAYLQEVCKPAYIKRITTEIMENRLRNQNPSQNRSDLLYSQLLIESLKRYQQLKISFYCVKKAAYRMNRVEVDIQGQVMESQLLQVFNLALSYAQMQGVREKILKDVIQIYQTKQKELIKKLGLLPRAWKKYLETVIYSKLP